MASEEIKDSKRLLIKQFKDIVLVVGIYIVFESTNCRSERLVFTFWIKIN